MTKVAEKFNLPHTPQHDSFAESAVRDLKETAAGFALEAEVAHVDDFARIGVQV